MSTACPPGRTPSAISITVTSAPSRASSVAIAGPARPPPLTSTRLKVGLFDMPGSWKRRPVAGNDSVGGEWTPR